MYHTLHRPGRLRGAGVTTPTGYGVWSPSQYKHADEEFNMMAVLPIPRTQFWGALALFSMTMTAIAGKTDTKSLLVAASVGTLGAIGLTLITGKD